MLLNLPLSLSKNGNDTIVVQVRACVRKTLHYEGSTTRGFNFPMCKSAIDSARCLSCRCSIVA